MATNTTTTLSNQYQRYFNKVLLDTAVHELKFNQFGAKRQLPRGVGGKDIRFFRRVAANAADVQTLVEGTPISVFKDVTYTAVDATLAQIGEAAKYTDLVGWTALLDVLDDGIDLMGEDCALKADDITQAVCMAASGGLTKRYTGVTQTFAGLTALTAAQGKYVSDDGLAAVTQLRINRAPRKNGVYVGIVGPQVAFNLKRDTVWINASTYSAVKQLFQGEIGELDGIRYVEHTNPWGESSTEGTRDVATPTIWSSVFVGKDAYGVVELSGKGPNAPQIMISNKPDKSDPLNQLLIAGWSAFYTSVVLNPAFGIVVRSKTTFV
jgi:N4-gp56 family major capsid protein